MSPTFTVLLPVLRAPTLMRYAIDSVLSQTFDDFELCVIGDGAPPETIAFAEACGKSDPRVRVYAFEKGQRYGEAHRHAILEKASSRYVCQIADDDLWFPRHLEEMAKLLDSYEFGNTLCAPIGRESQIYPTFADLADLNIINRLNYTQNNLVGPTAVGYRLETYRSLPIGWSPAPYYISTDLFMWRKFLARPGIKLGTRFVLTSIHLGAALRGDRSDTQRAEEMKHFAQILKSAEDRDKFEQDFMRTAARESIWYQLHAQHWKTLWEKLQKEFNCTS